jgi:transposase
MTTEQQNDVIISLLARLAFGEERIADIVTRNKKNPDAYRKVYNSLDGVRTATELASIAKVSQQTMSEVLQKWEQEGIAFNMGTSTKGRYRKLMTIAPKGSKKT